MNEKPVISDGRVTYRDGMITCTAPERAPVWVGFYDDRSRYIDGEMVAAGETRMVAPRGAYFSVELFVG